MKCRRYWFPRARVPVTFHLGKDYRVDWTRIIGLDVAFGRRSWFIGMVESRDAASVLPGVPQEKE